MRFLLSLAVLCLTAVVATPQQASVADVLKRFEQAKPTDKELAFYSLDWVCSLAEAKERAKAERRPILLIVNTNITAHCNFYSGHT
jgi:hypothetical protein